VAGLTTEQVAGLQTEDLAALGTEHIVAMSSTQIQAIGTSSLVALSTSDLAALHDANQQGFLSAGQVTALSTDQLQAILTSPIVLDLDRDGIQTSSVSSGVAFDIRADGRPVQTGWTSGGDGLLVRDLNGDGQITSGSELFGNATRLTDGRTAANGFEALGDLDVNRDGRIDSADSSFSRLKVWVDANRDGQSQAGELKGLVEAGVMAINLEFTQGTTLQNGNLLGQVGSYVAADGSSQAAVDVWFATTDQAKVSIPKASELLAEAPHNLMPSGDPGVNPNSPTVRSSVPGSTEPVNSGPTRITLGMSDEELLRTPPPLI
jgi:hypothetical protein